MQFSARAGPKTRLSDPYSLDNINTNPYSIPHHFSFLFFFNNIVAFFVFISCIFRIHTVGYIFGSVPAYECNACNCCCCYFCCYCCCCCCNIFFPGQHHLIWPLIIWQAAIEREMAATNINHKSRAKLSDIQRHTHTQARD